MIRASFLALPRVAALTLFVVVVFVVDVSRTESDELNVPYVPYVVVNKNKDAFDYDRLQRTIVDYLESRAYRNANDEGSASSETLSSTTLYDFLKANSFKTEPKQQQTSNIDAQQFVNVRPSSYQANNYFEPVTGDDSPSATAALVKIRPAAQSSYRPDTSPITFTENVGFNASSAGAYYSSPTPPPPPPPPPPTVTEPFLMSLPKNEIAPQEVIISPIHEYPYIRNKIPRNGVEVGPSFALSPYAGAMKCSLRSSRYVFDGDCRSRKPVVETVCAERCIKYEYNKFNNPAEYSFVRNPLLRSPHPKKISNTAKATKQVIALKCYDGNVRKQKVKLYCHDGTVINNVIRIVSSCICQEHIDKVHTTKRNIKSNKKSNSKLSTTINKSAMYEKPPSPPQRLLVRKRRH